VSGNLTADQREDLLRVAHKCPVHKLMTEVTTEITTSLAP
jgi:putative redox protein